MEKGELRSEVTQESMMETIRYMTEHFPYRLAGSPCEAAAAEYVANRMKEYGLEVDNETFYTYNIYDIYNTVKDANGNEVKQINQTFKLSVPSSYTKTYRIEADGTRTLIDETSSEASTGMLIRTQILEKLFTDSEKLLSGIEIDRDAVN